jgi:DNA-binding PadR family transcriptional regulator
MPRDPLPTGQIDLLLLSLVARRPAHGYIIIEELRLLTAGALDLPEGTIYPALYRLERLGLVTSGESTVDGRRRRIYRITPPGRTALQDRSDAWRTLVKQVEAVLRAAPLRA